jgi:hypothetical protein
LVSFARQYLLFLTELLFSFIYLSILHFAECVVLWVIMTGWVRSSKRCTSLLHALLRSLGWDVWRVLVDVFDDRVLFGDYYGRWRHGSGVMRVGSQVVEGQATGLITIYDIQIVLKYFLWPFVLVRYLLCNLVFLIDEINVLLRLWTVA